VRQDGTLLYQAGQIRQSADEWAQRPGVAPALRGESGTTYLTTEEGEHVVAFSPITVVGWALVVEEPWHIVADPLLRTTEITPLVLVPAVVIALAGLWFGVRQIVQPLQSLARRATGLAAGDFTGIEEPVGGIQEIRQLQAELIQMAHKVQLAQKSLRGYLSAVKAGQEEERRRLARELHDETIQSLIALNQRVQLAQMAQAAPVQDVPMPVVSNGQSNDSSTAAQLDEIQQMTTQVIADLRRLTRNLRPIYLDDLGLTPALKMLALDMGQALQIPIEFRLFGLEYRLQPVVELALYRIAQEALNNVGRHAQASRAEVCLEFRLGAAILTVRDDGQGFVAGNPSTMASGDHFGLLGIQERAELIGAHLEIQSTLGEGTCISVTVPFSGEQQREQSDERSEG
jgi:signal transduction histidine kinase